jgi:hypothetical protein
MTDRLNAAGLAKNVVLMKAGVRQMRQLDFFSLVSQKYKKRG